MKYNVWVIVEQEDDEEKYADIHARKMTTLIDEDEAIEYACNV